jgi:small subunit ribosomal protein S9
MADEERPDAPGEDTPDLAADDVAEPMPAADPSEAPIDAAEPTAEDPAAGEPPAAEQEAAAEEAPAAEEPPAAEAEPAQAEETPAEAPAADAATPEDTPPVEEAPAATEPAAPAAEAPAPPAPEQAAAPSGDEAVPGAHLEPDLVLETPSAPEGEFGLYGDDDSSTEAATAEGETAEQPAPRKVMDLAADARYIATGKRKTAVARVILRPGSGAYTINGRTLDEFFPRPTLQRTARGPLETAGYETRMDVVARLHGGGVSAQAGALRHGIARALVEADPNLRGEMKKAGFLTRDARAKERKKAGLKKARKRPQFSKR